MAPTYSTDVPNWIPDVISASLYDTMGESQLTLSGSAATYDDLDGTPGDSLTIPTIAVTTPADDLAENVAAVDDKLTSGGVTVTVKEAVKSVSWSDRTRVQSGQDVNVLAGRRVGGAINDRVELDLAAAALAGRLTSKDTNLGTVLTLANLRTMRAKIPVRLRRRGIDVFATDDVLEGLFADTTVANAAAFGSDEAIRNGAFARPLYGLNLKPVDEAVFANVTIGAVTGPPVVFVARGMLLRAWQKQPSSEVERDARGRLTRVVGTAFHAEGVIEAAGIVVGNIG